MQELGYGWDGTGRSWIKSRNAWRKVLRLLRDRASIEQFNSESAKALFHDLLRDALLKRDFRGASLALSEDDHAYLETIYPQVLKRADAIAAKNSGRGFDPEQAEERRRREL